MITELLKKEKIEQCLIGISLFSYLFFAYNISLREHVYASNIILFASLMLPVFLLLYVFRKKIKELLPLTTKILITAVILLFLILFRNKDLMSGHFGMPYYYIVTILLFLVLCNSSNWIKAAINIMILFTMEHVLSTWIFYIFPEFYQNYVMPLFPKMFQSDLLFQLKNGQMAGLTYHYSTNGMYLALGSILVTGLLLKEDTKKKRIFYIIFFLLTLGALLLTAKRAHLLFSVLAIILTYIINFRGSIKKALPKLFVIIITLIIVMSIAAVFIPALGNTVDRFVKFFNANDMTNGRIPLFKLAIEEFLAQPILGNGWGSYKYTYEEKLALNPNYNQLDTHNIYLQLLSEVGILGTIFTMIVILGSVYICYKTIKNGKLSSINEKALLISFGIQIFIILYGITGNSIYDVQIFFQYMIALAMTYAISIEEKSFIQEKNAELYKEKVDTKGKIGVLTFQNTTNYGAEMQKYALQKYIQNLNYDCEVIDYKCDSVEKRELAMDIFKQRNINDLIKCIMRSDSQYIRHIKFKNFSNKYIKISNKEYTRENITDTNDKYDFFLVGSDQVWNMNLTDGDYTYLLDFVTDDKKKLSFAASFGYKEIPSEYLEDNKKLLSKFNVLNVREKQGKKILDDFIKKKVNTTVDPTFLLKKEEWDSLLIDHNHKEKHDYIFVYLPYYSKDTFDFIRDLAKKEKCKIIYIHGSLRNEIGMKNLRTASPIDFLDLIKNAKYIVTGSFHAICFSIIFEKEFFYTVSTIKKFNSRLEDLIELVDLKSRKVEENYYKVQDKIDYAKVKKLINVEIENSKKILELTLGGKND